MSTLPPLSNTPRIEILDGFRAIAVIAVVTYHYFFSFAIREGGLPDYPAVDLMSRGLFGVHLFFMISGFVIYRSMDQSASIKEFLVKRYLRLAPALILASIFTYIVVEWWNTSDRVDILRISSPLDFLFSFTFIYPGIWNSLLGRNDIEFIDGAYWSLWPEVIFYIAAGIVYFNSQKQNFLRNWFLVVLVVNLLRIATSPKLAAFTPEFMLPIANGYYRTFLLLNLSFWPYFTTGILFYSLWIKRAPNKLVWVLAIVLFSLQMFFSPGIDIRLLFVAAIALWTIFLLRPHWLRFLQWRPIQLIGLISYPLYLLHESAGIVLTEKLVRWTHHSVPVFFLLIVVLAVFILLAYFVFVIFERPVTRTLKEKLLGVEPVK
jgi:peptidoglycan/LPS O-acetylase OafA/YrhL